MWFWGWFFGLWFAGAMLRRRGGILNLKNLLERSLHVMIGIGVGTFLLTMLVAIGQLSSGESAGITGLFCAGSAWLVILPALELIQRAASGSRDSLQAEVARQLAERKASEAAAAERSAEAAHDVAEARTAMRAADAALSAAMQRGDGKASHLFDRPSPEASGPEMPESKTQEAETEAGAKAIASTVQEATKLAAAVLITETDGGAKELPLAAEVATLKKKKSAKSPQPVAGETKAEANAARSVERQATAAAGLRPEHPLQRPSGPISLSGALRSSFSGGERSVGGSSAVSSTASQVTPTLSGSAVSSRFSYQPQLIQSRLTGSEQAAAPKPAGPKPLPPKPAGTASEPSKAQKAPKTA